MHLPRFQGEGIFCILTHEVGHAVGFLSLATQTGTFQVQSGSASTTYSTMLYTKYDSLLTNQEGSPS